MKKSLFLGTLIAALAIGQAANAALWTTSKYVDIDAVQVWLSADNPSYSGSFDITSGNSDGDVFWDKLGFNPATEALSAVEIGFAFRNEQDVQQVVKVSMGDAVDTGSIAPGNHELVYGISSVFFQGTLWATLQSTGILNWTVSIDDVQGSDAVYFKAAALGADVVPFSGNGPVAKVPDNGSTYALLSVALFGLVVLGRRQALAVR